jgi:very-short-patch-repair endonuclease
VIEHWIETCRLHVIYPCAYAVGHPAIDRLARWHAAVLSCGPGGVLSHRDAGALYWIRDDSRRAIDVTAPGRSRNSRAGITIHRPRTLHADDVTVYRDVPVTTVSRTLLDLAEVVPRHQLRRAFAQANRSGLLDMNELYPTLERARGRRGLRAMRWLLAQRVLPPEANPGLEEDLADLTRELDLPDPAFNVAIPGTPYVADGAYIDRNVLFELDSKGHHDRTAEDFEYERVRLNELQLAGYIVLRLTHHRIHRQREAAKADVFRAFHVEPVAPAKS